MGRLGLPQRVLVLTLLAAALGSCQHAPTPGVLHVVQPGETIYRIAHRYGVGVTAIVEANGIRDVHDVAVGTRLWIPRAGTVREPLVLPPLEVRERARAETWDTSALAFAWPLRGRLTSGFGIRDGRMHDGIDLAARRGSLVRAAEAGRVVFSSRLGDYGRVVVVRHDARFASVYAHNRRNRVQRGAFVDKGTVVAELGASGNATGPHLHFEIRRDDEPLDPLLFLP